VHDNFGARAHAPLTIVPAHTLSVREPQTQKALSKGRFVCVSCKYAPQTQKVLFFRSYGPQTRAPCVDTGAPQAQKAASFALCLISNILSLSCSLAVLLSLWLFLSPSLSLVRSPFLSLPLAWVILLLALVRSVLVCLSLPPPFPFSLPRFSPTPPPPSLLRMCSISLAPSPSRAWCVVTCLLSFSVSLALALSLSFSESDRRKCLPTFRVRVDLFH